MADAARRARTVVVHRLRSVGVDVYGLRRQQLARRTFRENRTQFEQQLPSSRSGRDFPFGRDLPRLHDRFEDAGEARGQYFHQDLLVARWVHDAQPARHVDVGSRIDGFVAHVASFRTVEVIDIRPLTTTAHNIVFHRRDMTVEDPAWDACTDSLSCLHALEHFGLGRYGDPVDVDGWVRGWDNLVRMVAPGGHLYFSVPIGPQRVEFDAHRVFSVPFLLDLVRPTFTIESFFYVDDAGELHGPADPDAPAAASSFGCDNGCGIFALRCDTAPRRTGT
jgi:hypothetical protein